MKPTLDQILYSMDDTEAAAHLSDFLNRGFKYAVREDANWYFYRNLPELVQATYAEWWVPSVEGERAVYAGPYLSAKLCEMFRNKYTSGESLLERATSSAQVRCKLAKLGEVKL